MRLRKRLGLAIGAKLIALAGCASPDAPSLALTTGASTIPAPAVQLASVRASDAETAAQIASNGSLLYSADGSKYDWKHYCRGSHHLANQGNFRLAVREASKAFFLGSSSGNSLAMAHASRDLAFAYSLAGDLTNARRWADAALKYARRAPSTADLSVVTGPAHKVIADVELRHGRIANAIAAYEEALKIGPDRIKMQARASMANAEVANRNFARARQLFRDALDGTDASFVPFIRRGEAELALAEDKPADALRLFNEAAASADDYSRVWALRGAGIAHKRLGHQKEALASYKQAIAVAGTLRARFHSEEFKTGFFGQLQTVYDEATEELVAAGAADTALETSEQGRARAMLDLLRGRVAVAGKGTGNAVVDPVGQPETVAAIKGGLAPRQALVAFHVLPTRTLVWTVTKDGTRIATAKIGGKALEQKVRALREAIEKRKPTATALSRELYDHLVAPASLGNADSVVFVPHKALHLLPFQALRGPSGWLVQERAVGTVPSASALVSLQRQRLAAPLSLLALGNPTPASNDPPLPGAEGEVRKISTIVKGAEAFVGQDATKSRFMSRAPSSNIVHIAAHAMVDDLDPLYSVVRLAKAPDGSGGDLEAHEVYRLQLAATRMVVLSACDSGSGRISSGDEFWGFQRTFLGAGARTLLLTHWPVYDQSAPKLMERFYVHLEGKTAAEALRLAQLDVMKMAGFADPVHWASFSVVGSPS